MKIEVAIAKSIILPKKSLKKKNEWKTIVELKLSNGTPNAF